MECGTPLSSLTPFSPWIFPPPPSATQPESRLAAVLCRAESSYRVQGSGLDICEEIGEVGKILPVLSRDCSWLWGLSLPGIHGKKVSTPFCPAGGASPAQTPRCLRICPATPSLPSPFLPKSECLGWLLSSRTSQGRQEGGGTLSFSRAKFLALPQGALAARRQNCACSPFLLLPEGLPKFNSNLSSSEVPTKFKKVWREEERECSWRQKSKYKGATGSVHVNTPDKS